MRLNELAAEFNKALSERYDENEPEALFFVALDHVLGYSRTDYILRKADQLTSESESRLLNILHELQNGKPIQYIIGHTVFFGLTIKVNESVLIPRPETEELVDWILTTVADRNSRQKSYGDDLQLNILDVGTGSGCIAISLRKHLPGSTVFALDISKEALSIARQNSVINQIDINTIHTDIRTYTTQVKFDLIVSNPPYITIKERETMEENVLNYEPHLALFVDDDEPLIFYESIARFALSHLKDGGLLVFEINENYGKETVDMLLNKGFNNIELRKDMQGKDRMIRCNRFSYAGENG